MAAELLDMKLLEILGISLLVMGIISAAIFEFATRGGGVTLSAESEQRVTAMKGEEYETVLAVESRAMGWIGSTPTTFSIETGQLKKFESSSDGRRIRLRFLGTYAGRAEGIKVGISMTDPLRLFKRLDEVVDTRLVLDTLPLSLFAPMLPRRVKVFGFGERPTGYPGQGQELYGLDEYRYAGDTKDIVWRRVAKSPDESLVSRVREANVRDVVRVGVVRFAERKEDDDERALWTDSLCEALGEVGREILETGSVPELLFHDGGHEGRPRAPSGAADGESGEKGEQPPILGKKTSRSAAMVVVMTKDVNELAEAVMQCSIAGASRDIEGVVRGSDIVVTGLRELEDERMAKIIAQKPLLLIRERQTASSVPPPPLPAFALTERSVVWTGKVEDLFPLIRKTLEG